MPKRRRYPRAIDPMKVGKYRAYQFAGGGLVWDAVLEYRVWVHPTFENPDEADEGDWYRAFADYPSALRFSRATPGAEEPLALILQREYLDEPRAGHYVHVKRRRMTEWPIEFLSRPRRTSTTIPNFLAPDAPQNRLAILRGTAKKRK